MHKQTLYILLPPSGEPLSFNSKKEANQKKKEIKGSYIFDAVIYTDESLNKGNQ